ncbi:MAG: hypothetical protein WBA54_15820 [Acidaminobacteraceae bacterium]
MYNTFKHLLRFGIKSKVLKSEIRKLDFDYLKKTNEYATTSKSTLDEVTWNDMNMNSVFQSINYTSTSAGEEVLYSWLRNPLDNVGDYKNRISLINHLELAVMSTSKMKLAFEKVGYCKYHLKEIMESKYESNKWMSLLHILLSLANLMILINLFISGVSTITGIIFVLFPINIFLHYNFKEKYGSQLEVLQYTIKLINFCKSNIDEIRDVSPALASQISQITNRLKSISKKEISVFKAEGLDLFADYINITFLIKEISYFSIAGKVQNLKIDINELYDNVGSLDAAISVITYRQNLALYCEPNFNNNYENIVAEEVYHPLLLAPVPNTINISSAIAITGSNMSGKSTFLRTLGLNVILAQSICTCLAKKYEAKFYRLITSISLNDTILESKSYFLMEAEAIKRMLDLKDNEYPTLILIDEIFKGTNPIERYAASMEILNNLEEGNTKVIVATHDLNILPELKGYEFYYFTENVSSKSLEFDFKLRSGTATSRNAVKILEYVKYPSDLVIKINLRISSMEVESLE